MDGMLGKEMSVCLCETPDRGCVQSVCSAHAASLVTLNEYSCH